MADNVSKSSKNWIFRFFLLVLLATFIPTTTVAISTLTTSSQALRKEAEVKLAVTNDSTREQLIRWTKDNRDDLVFESQISPEFVKKLEQFFQISKDSKERVEIRASLAANEIKRFLDHHDNFFELFILDPTTGEVVISSDPRQEGKLKTDRSYFQIGKRRPYTQNVYFSLTLQQQATTIGTPVFNETGVLIAVLAGRASLETLNDVLRRPEGLGETAQSYAVNSFKFIVAGLQKGREEYSFRPLNTFPVLEALQGNAGVAKYTTFNEVEVVGSYLPVPDLDLVVITEIDEEEVLQPIQTLKGIVLAVTAFSVLITVLVAVLITRILLSSTQKYREQLEEKVKELQHQKNQLDITAQMLIRRDKEVRIANVELEKEKDVISAERNKLEVIISGITDAVIAVDVNQNIIMFNKAAEVAIGFTSKEVLAKPISQVIKLFDKNEELLPITYCPIIKGEYEGVVFSKNNLKMSGADKRELYVNLIAAKIKEGTRVNLGCILTLHDVTKEHELEEMKLDFVSMAAHELRTPLTSIRGYADVLISEIGDKIDPESKEGLNRLSISAINLDNLIDNLLHVSRIEEGTFKVKMFPCDSVKIIREVMSNFKEQTNSKNQTLEFIEPEEKIPPIMADRFRIAQVLSNLLSNAVSYTKPGGKITILLRKKGKYLAVSVIDTGIGIPREALPKLFTKFFRISGPLEEGSKGTGLGLFISESIVKMHKGNIWAESELGKGSTFTFTIPVAKKREIKKYKGAKKEHKLPSGSESIIIMNKERLGD